MEMSGFFMTFLGVGIVLMTLIDGLYEISSVLPTKSEPEPKRLPPCASMGEIDARIDEIIQNSNEEQELSFSQVKAAVSLRGGNRSLGSVISALKEDGDWKFPIGRA